MMLVSTRTTYTSIFWNTFKKVYILVRNLRRRSDGRLTAGRSTGQRPSVSQCLDFLWKISGILELSHEYGHPYDWKRILFRIQSYTKKKFKLWIRFGIWASLFFDGRPIDRLSRIPNQKVNSFESVSKHWCVRCPSTYQHHHRSIKYQSLR